MYSPDEMRRDASSHLVVAVDRFNVQIGDLDIIYIHNILSVKLHFTVTENLLVCLICMYLDFTVYFLHWPL